MNYTSNHKKPYPTLSALFIYCIALLNMAIFAIEVHAQGGTALFGIINNYAAVTEYNSCAKTVKVLGVNAFKPKMKVLMIQMQGAKIDTTNTADFGKVLDYGNAGNAEVLEIDTIIGSSIIFKYAPLRQYDPENAPVQLVTIPIYDTAFVSVFNSLTCEPWNGRTGGILAFEVRIAFELNGTIDLSGRGFLGGNIPRAGRPGSGKINVFDYALSDLSSSLDGGEKGSGIGILQREYLLGRGSPANGGGGGNAHNSGGGGGANGGAGGIGSKDFPDTLNHIGGIGGKPLPYQQFVNEGKPRLFMGGGGGAGHDNNFASYKGGAGGAIAYIRANNVILRENARIINNGADVGGPRPGSSNDGYGAGGAGGTVYFDVDRFIPYAGSFLIEAKGGQGGSTSAPVHGPGGGGGGGAILFKNRMPNNAVIDINGGKPGMNTAHNSTLSAGPGTSGLVIEDITFIESSRGVMALQVSKDTSICEKSTVQLTVQPLGGKAPFTYRWYGTNIADTTAQSTSARPINDESYRVVVTDASGCSNFAFVKVTVLPAPSLNLPVNSRIACKGDTIILEANSMQEITWLPVKGLLENKGNQVRCIVDSAITYTIFAETQSGCSGTDTIRIEVDEAPSISNMTRVIERCADEDSVLIPEQFIFNDRSTYISTWFTAKDTLSIDSTFKQIKVKPDSSTVYYVEFTTNNGCRYRDSVHIIMHPLPMISIQSDTTICRGNTLQLSASGGITYAWSPANGLSDSTIANPIASPNVNTRYYVKVTSQVGCSAIDSVLITIAEPPQKPILSRRNDTLFVIGDGSNYEWFFNGRSMTPPHDSIRVIDTSGYYSVIAKTAYCSTMSDSLFVSIGNARISIDSIILNNNETSIVQIRALDTMSIQESGITGIKLTLSWNPTVAEITHPEFMNVTGTDIKTAEITLSLNELPIIGSLSVRGLLGNAPETSISIDSIKPIGGLFRTSTINGNVKIGDICYEGGIRLWHADKTVSRARISINPHPIESISEIRLDIPERGRFTLKAYSPIGIAIPIAEGFTLPGTLTAQLPFEAMSSGMYTLVLETPTEYTTLPIIINK